MKTLGSPASSKVERELFGRLSNGTDVERVRLFGDNGFEVRIITYGAALQTILVPDRTGCIADVVLGHEKLAKYVEDRRFFGATVGRFANRIENGTFELDGMRYQLVINDGLNSLHGGKEGFDRKNWTIWGLGDNPVPFVTLVYVSPEGEEGYPGALEVFVTFSISGSMELSITFRAVADKPTIVNLTNHSFFNLKGSEAGGDILDHLLTVEADSYLPVNNSGIPLLSPDPVGGTPFDFRKPTRLGKGIRNTHAQICARQGYDHNFCLYQGLTRAPRRAAYLQDLMSGRSLELLTDQPGLQLYSGNLLDGTVTGKYGCVYSQYGAVCLEPQIYPDAPNRPDFPSAKIMAGQSYCQNSVYRFSAD